MSARIPADAPRPATGPQERPGQVAAWLRDARAATPVDDEDRPGDPACLLRRVCPACGAVADEDPPTICPACHADLPAG